MNGKVVYICKCRIKCEVFLEVGFLKNKTELRKSNANLSDQFQAPTKTLSKAKRKVLWKPLFPLSPDFP